MKNSNKTKPRDLNVKNRLREYGRIVFPSKSASINVISTRNVTEKPNKHPGGVPSYKIKDFTFEFNVTDNERDDHYAALINPSIHNCVCHKLAALCFFEWSPKDGHYVLTPLIDGEPTTFYLTLGHIEEISD